MVKLYFDAGCALFEHFADKWQSMFCALHIKSQVIIYKGLHAICEQSVLLQAPADEAAAACVTLNPALNLQQPRFD